MFILKKKILLFITIVGKNQLIRDILSKTKLKIYYCKWRHENIIICFYLKFVQTYLK